MFRNENANSGYVGYSMSVRAESAYEEGLLTKSKITKEDLTDVDIYLPVSFVKSLMPHRITPAKWHHTGMHFNETDFYEPLDIKEQLDELNTDELLEEFKEEEKEQKEKRLLCIY